MSVPTIAAVRERLARHSPQRIDETVAPRRAAVSVILHELHPGEGCSILFIHRSRQADDPWSGHMAFPGGRLDPGDLSALHAARRETLEEVGIDLERDAELLGQLDDQRASARGNLLPLAITPFVFHLHKPATLRINHEVAEALWIPVERLLDPAAAGTVPYELDGVHFQLPCIIFRTRAAPAEPGSDRPDRIIWGLTHQMLTRFFRLMGWGEAAAAPR